MRKRLDEPNGSRRKSRVTERLFRYQVELEIESQSGVMRVMNERLSALRQRGEGEKARNSFVEKTGATLSLRMEGQGHPTMHELGPDEVGPGRSLLICCSAFRGKSENYPHLELKKIPKAVLSKCEWGHDDYSLKIENLPKAPPKAGQPELFSTANKREDTRMKGNRLSMHLLNSRPLASIRGFQPE